MTFRTRLALWYTGIMFVSLLAMVALSYHEFVVDPRNDAIAAKAADAKGDPEDNPVVQSLGIVLWCGLPAALLAVGGGWWLTRRALVPVVVLTQAAERLNERQLGEQLPRSGNGDEFDRLIEVFNAMSARLDNSFQRIREFTLHASHELKTPLTVLRGEMETQMQSAGLTDEHREFLASELDEVRRLAKIVDGLTLLTKAGAGQVALDFEPVQLDELVRDACADAQILARPNNIEVRLGSCDAFSMRGDRHRLRQLLLNLTDNAVKYNDSGGAVAIELRNSGNGPARLTIVNTGTPIPEESLARVFDPFFRGDASHNRAVEGCGLGLSIARWIVTAHGGTITLTSSATEPTRVVVTFRERPDDTRDNGTAIS